MSNMANETDTRKVVRQHGQIEQLFTGGFAVKGQSVPTAPKADSETLSAKQAQLDRIADEIRKLLQVRPGKIPHQRRAG